jgi:hypothetical protein
MQVATIEQLLTARAEIFVGTAMSTFTKEIIMERRFLGFDDWTKHSFTLLPGAKTRTMCGYGARIANPREDAYTPPGNGVSDGEGDCETW